MNIGATYSAQSNFQLVTRQIGYILSYNGGQIINVQTGELLFEKRIDPEWIPYFEKKAKKNDFAMSASKRR